MTFALTPDNEWLTQHNHHVWARRLHERRRRIRDGWMNEIQVVRDLFKHDMRRATREMTFEASIRLVEGVGKIAELRLLGLYLPMLETLRRIETNFARVPGYSLWHHDDIRAYTGNLRRVDGLS